MRTPLTEKRLERRAPDRPVNGDRRPCPICHDGPLVFHTRYSLAGHEVAAWACESPTCGYRTAARQVVDPSTHPVTRAEALVRESVATTARARRLAMKARANYERSREFITKARELRRQPPSMTTPASAPSVTDGRALARLDGGIQQLRDAVAYLQEAIFNRHREIAAELTRCRRELDASRAASCAQRRLMAGDGPDNEDGFIEES